MTVELRPPPGSSHGTGPILLALLVTALLVVPIAGAGDVAELVTMAVVLAIATAWAFQVRVRPAVRVVLLTDAMLAMVAVGGISIWPAPVVIAIGLIAVASRKWRELAPPADYIRSGRMSAEIWLLVGLTIALSAAALVVWAILVRPTFSPYLQWMAGQPVWLLLGGLAFFAVLNGIGEELLFRGIFVGELAAVGSARTAVVAVSVAFAIAHVKGFPSGWTGAIMAGCYGLALGVLRVRSGGMLAPLLAHIGADLTIGLLAVSLL